MNKNSKNLSFFQLFLLFFTIFFIFLVNFLIFKTIIAFVFSKVFYCVDTIFDMIYNICNEIKKMKIRIITNTKLIYDIVVNETNFDIVVNKILEKKYIKLNNNVAILTSAICEIQKLS